MRAGRAVHHHARGTRRRREGSPRHNPLTNTRSLTIRIQSKMALGIARCLSFVLMLLWLLFVPTSSDLTDKDLASIGRMIAESEVRTTFKIESLNLKVTKLQNSMTNMNESLNLKMTNMNESLTATINSGFQDLHSFSHRRVGVLEKSAAPLRLTAVDKSVSTGTMHALLVHGKVATIFTPHAKMSLADIDENPELTNVLLHPEFDFAILPICPPSALISVALNVSEYAIPALGDELIVYGHGASASVWTGIVSRVANFVNFVNCSNTQAQHWSGVTRICAGELIAQGHQHEGMSGAPVLNGCGYVGTAHAALMPDESKLANFAAITPAAVIFDFIYLHSDKLPTLATCGLHAEAPPVARFVDCSTRSLASSRENSICNNANRDGTAIVFGQAGVGVGGVDIDGV